MKKRIILLVFAVLMLSGCAIENPFSGIQKAIDNVLHFIDAGAEVVETASVTWSEETTFVSAEVTETVDVPTTAYAEETVPKGIGQEERPEVAVPATSPASNTLCKVCGQDYSEILDSQDGFCGPCFIDQLPPQVCERCHKSFKVVYIPTNGICPECERTPFAFNCLACGTPCISFNEKHLCDACEARFCYVCWEVVEEGHVCEE